MKCIPLSIREILINAAIYLYGIFPYCIWISQIGYNLF